MKNLIKIPLIIVLICCLSCGFVTAGATDSSDKLSVNAYFDIDASKLLVNGTVVSSKGYVPVVLTLKNADGKLIYAEQTVTGASDGSKVSFAFAGIPFQNTTPSGDYKIYVSAGYVKAENTVIYTYEGPDKRFNAINDVNTAISEKSSSKLIKAMSDYRSILVNGDETLFALDNGQSVFAKLFFEKGSYELPQNYDTDENVEKITASVQKIASNYKELLVIAEAADVKDYTSLSAWLDKYATDNKFYAEDDTTEYSEVKMGKYFDEAKEVSQIYAKVQASANSAEDFKELKDEMLKSGVLTLLETGKDWKIQEITESLPNLITVNTSDFDDLIPEKQAKVYQDLTDVPSFDSISDYISEFNKAVKNNASVNNNDKGGYTSGGSSKKGGGVTIVQAKPETSADDSQAQTNGFNDIADCTWAHEAIGYLSSKGVIAGRGQGIFDPYASTTRAEFIKMIAVAFGFGEGTYNGCFTDVSASDWYAPYVASAQTAGIATGTEDGRFLPGELITRQDMAVLLYRAKNMAPSQNEKDVFYDSYSISDYAKSAVFAMYEKGIALGTGDGNFAPLRNATRAEAAQMIYKVIMN